MAGLDAGLIYNTFPLMADRWIPSDMWSFEPLWKNVFENPTAVQFNHRMLAMTTYAAIIAFWIWSRRNGMPLPRSVKVGSTALLAVSTAQVSH